jgi:hypothetical protein
MALDCIPKDVIRRIARLIHKENSMKKAVMTGLAALCGTFAAAAWYMKRWFPVREICVVHSIIVLTIPALFIGCGPPVGALFDDTPLKIQLQEVAEVPVEITEITQDTILKRKVLFYFNGGFLPSGGDALNFAEVFDEMIQGSAYGDVFSLTAGGPPLFEGNAEQMAYYLRSNWGNLESGYKMSGQGYTLEILPRIW